MFDCWEYSREKGTNYQFLTFRSIFLKIVFFLTKLKHHDTLVYNAFCFLGSQTVVYVFLYLMGFVLWLQSRETHGLVPVTVKQIREASQCGDEKSNFVINGVDVVNVIFISCFLSLSTFNPNYYIALFCSKKQKNRIAGLCP